MARPKHQRREPTPPPALPDWFDPDDRSWHGYKRTWRSDAMWVDVRPVADLILKKADEINEGVKKIENTKRDHHNGLTDRDMARIAGCAGEAAVAMLLGGHTMGKGKKGDVRLRSGRIVEVKTRLRGWPFARYAPSANCNKKHFPKSELVLCVTEGYPKLLERVCVVGWLPQEDLYDHRVWSERNGGGFWEFQWKDGPWRHVAEIMNDELFDPLLHIGMPGRRTAEDRGLPMYIEYYVSGRDPLATGLKEDRTLSDLAASDRQGAPSKGDGAPHILRPKELN